MDAKLDTRAQLPRLLASLLVLAALMVPLVRAGVAGQTAVAQGLDVPLDLPAMAFTPADLEQAGLEGFGLTYGGLTTLDGAAELAAMDRGGTDADNIARYAQLLRESGWQRTYESALASPSQNDRAKYTLGLLVDLSQFADEDGGANAFAVLTNAAEVTATTVEVLPWRGDGVEIDDAVLWRYDGIRRSTGDRFHALDLSLRLANLTAVVSLRDFGTDEPDVATVATLAETLVERIAAVRAGETSGLSRSALRFAVPYDMPNYDNYIRRLGQDSGYYAEPKENAEYRRSRYPETPDVYVVYQNFAWSADEDVDDTSTSGYDPDDTVFRSYLYQFADEDSASAWLHDVTWRLPLRADVPIFGDESFTYTCVCVERIDRQGFGTYVRVGATVARFELVASFDLSVATFVEVAHAQTDCLVSGNCLDPISPPHALLTTPDGSTSGMARDAAVTNPEEQPASPPDWVDAEARNR